MKGKIEIKMFFLANSILQGSLTGMANRSVIVGAILAFLLLVRLIRGMKDGDSKKATSGKIELDKLNNKLKDFNILPLQLIA